MQGASKKKESNDDVLAFLNGIGGDEEEGTEEGTSTEENKGEDAQKETGKKSTTKETEKKTTKKPVKKSTEKPEKNTTKKEASTPKNTTRKETKTVSKKAPIKKSVAEVNRRERIETVRIACTIEKSVYDAIIEQLAYRESFSSKVATILRDYVENN